MKVAVISYHSNIHSIYPEYWVKQYRESIENQSYKKFDLYECNYGPTPGMIFWKSNYESKRFENFVYCMNYMIDKLFSVGYDVVFNSNADDLYDKDWVKKTLPLMSKYDIVSCNFKLFNEEGVYHEHRFEKLNIKAELLKNHNVICHPGVCYSKRFWERGNRYNPEEIPEEDLKLWQRSINNSNFYIHPDHLVLHRVHDNAVCRSANR